MDDAQSVEGVETEAQEVEAPAAEKPDRWLAIVNGSEGLRLIRAQTQIKLKKALKDVAVSDIVEVWRGVQKPFKAEAKLSF